ncbi:MAG: CotH kinase family protein [Clostridia bacterium]|nr:CotH kinase family protein [Clostridia bacterium]
MNAWKKRLALLLALLMAVLGTACGREAEDDGSRHTEMPYESKLFDPGVVHTIDVSIAERDWADLIANPLEKTKYAADVTIDGETVERVSFATKGNTSLSFVANDADSNRYSFKINFGKYVTGQTYYGLNKLNLNNLYADATCMKDYFCYRIFRQAGVDAPLVSYVWLTINGEDHGLYLAIEDLSESYLERTNGGEGVLYKPETAQLDVADRADAPNGGAFEPPENAGQPPQGGMQPPNGAFPGQGNPSAGPGDGQTAFPQGSPGAFPPQQGDEDGMPQPGNGMPGGGQMPGGFGGSNANGADLKYVDNDTESYADIFDNAETADTVADRASVIEALKALASGSDPETFLYCDEIVRYFAAHNFVLNYDSYTGTMLHNYYLYVRDGKLAMLPWDYNLAFGAFGGGGRDGMTNDATALINTGVDTPLSGTTEADRPMWSWIVSNAKYLDRYHEALDGLLETYFENGAFEKEIDAVYEMIRPYVEKDPSAFYSAEAFETGYRTLKETCLLRAKSIRAQLDGRLSSETDSQNAADRIDASGIVIDDMGSQGGNGMPNGNPMPPEGNANGATPPTPESGSGGE